MKALTLTQPWATFVACGVKLTETRSWSTKYTGWLAIHAAKGMPRRVRELCEAGLFKTWIERCGYTVDTLPRGAVVCRVTMLSCYQIRADFCPKSESAFDRQFGDYTPGRFGWVFGSVVRYDSPIPAVGHLGLWEWTP